MATTDAANGGGNQNNNGGNNQNNNGGNNQNNNANGNAGKRRKRMLNIREKRSPPSAQQKADLGENLLRVDVYFETLSVQSITEAPKYNVRKLTKKVT